MVEPGDLQSPGCKEWGEPDVGEDDIFIAIRDSELFEFEEGWLKIPCGILSSIQTADKTEYAEYADGFLN